MDGLYHGKMTVEYYSYNTENSEVQSFQLYSFTDCESLWNSVTLSFSSSPPAEYFLFENTSPVQVTWSIASRNMSSCTEDITYRVKVKKGTGSWTNVNDDPLGQTASFASYPDNTELRWKLLDDINANPTADYLALKGSYTMKVLADNMALGIFGKGWESEEKAFEIKGCYATPSTMPALDFTIHSASDAVFKVPFWGLDDGLSPTQCWVETYTIDYVDSEDGSDSTFN